jgi:dihydropteroate synthase
MNYQRAAKFLRNLHEFDPPDADSTVTRRLLETVGDPHEDVQVVQVTGSNGKGSTVSMTERILREAGYDVGAFTTPHPLDLRKSVTVNGRPMARDAVAEFVGRVRDEVTAFVESDEAVPAYFEVLTALALWEFDRQDVDVAVVEVGCGGARDPTSVIDPAVAAVTNVSLEHTNLLGETREEIASEKAAIAPTDGPLVTGATGEALDAVREVADEVVTVGDGDPGDDSPAKPDASVRYEGREDVESRVSVAGVGLDFQTRVSQLGEYQAQNAGVAVALARQFARVSDRPTATGQGSVPVSEAVCRRGLRSVQWPGRCEILSREPLVVLDGAGNADAAANLAELLGSFEHDRLHLVFSALAPKPHEPVVEALPTPDLAVACQPDQGPWEKPAVLEAAFADAGADATASRPTIADAFDCALSEADADDLVLVTGSIIVALEARHHWTHATIPKGDASAMDLDRRFPTLDDASRRAVRAASHRTFATTVQSQQARHLDELLDDLGGTCVVVDEDMDVEQTRDVVLSGTDAQFEALVERLESDPFGMSALAEDLRGALGDDDSQSRSAVDDRAGAQSDSRAAMDSDDAVNSEETGRYPWTDGTAVMGVLDCGPGARLAQNDPTEAVAAAESMVAAGADVVDVQARPSEVNGSDPDSLSAEAERSRVVSVVEQLADIDALVAVSTTRGSVARAALDAGAGLVVDDSGLADPEMRFALADSDASLVVTHATDDPALAVEYDDVVADAMATLQERIVWAEQAGVAREQILVAPGLGLGKSDDDSAELVARLDEYGALGRPVVATPSRATGREGGDSGSPAELVALSTAAVERGADLLRVRDVAAAVDAVAVGESMRGQSVSN